MPRLTLNDFKKRGLLHIDAATGDDITSASGVAGSIRIMAMLISHSSAGAVNIEDAATFSSADVLVQCLANESNFISFAPHGWRVTYISTSTTGSGTIFYMLDE